MAENQSSITNYFAEKLPTMDPTTLQLIDLNFLAAYDKNFGFRICLDQITGLTETGKLFQVLASVCPPANPYLTQRRNMQAAYPFVNFDWQSTHDTFRFTHSDEVVIGVALVKSSCLVFDIKEFDIGKKAIGNFGFAVLPLITTF